MATRQIETVKWFTPDQLSLFMSKIDNARDKALFSMMYYHGLRRIEAVSLNLSDVRLKDERIYIHAAKDGISGEYALSRKVKKHLLAYLKVRGIEEAALFLSRKTNNGKALSTTQVSRLFSKYALKAKLPKDLHHPHVLRHSIAVHMADSGVPQEHVKLLLRHRKSSSTDVYYQITNRKRDEFISRAWEGEFVVNI